MKISLLCPDITLSPDLTFYKTSCSDLIWENGAWIDTEIYDVSNLEFIIENTSGRTMTDYAVSDMGCPIVSERLKLFLEHSGMHNIQYFKAQILDKNRSVHTNSFYVANIIGLANCIDIETSEMDIDQEEDEPMVIYSIEKLKLKECILDQPILRLASFTRVVLADETIKNKITQADFTGIKFIKPEDWDGINGEK